MTRFKKKAEKSSNSRIFLLKAEEVAALCLYPSDSIQPVDSTGKDQIRHRLAWKTASSMKNQSDLT
jgi:hypothetical protein